jgi:RNA polymerase sigma-70 factor (ECF subfamily)
MAGRGLRTSLVARELLEAQRLVRAKRKIQEARIPYEVPPAHRLAERLTSVQAVVYLIFNEGYSAATGDQLVRRDLCMEAIRLGRVLCELLPREAENIGLLALMLLHDSRRDARVSNGQLVTLEEQDRSLWDHGEISEGLVLVDRALTLGPVGPYQLQAAIAALHSGAKTAQETDWRQIAALYEKLLEFNASSVIALNRAVAIAMSVGLREGLQAIDALGPSGELEKYYLFHAARADVLFRMDRLDEAAAAYRNALALAGNRIEQDFLTRRLVSVEGKLRHAHGS